MAKLVSLPPLDIVQRYEIDDACGYLKQSRGKTYKDIAAGRLKIIKDGRRTYVPGSEIARVSAVPSGDA